MVDVHLKYYYSTEKNHEIFASDSFLLDEIVFISLSDVKS
jgi:hypothetical protein